jgi:16S rRNA (guanine527-N7)-methyltransferase
VEPSLESGYPFHVEHEAQRYILESLSAHGFPSTASASLLRLCELVSTWNRSSNLTAQSSPSELAVGLCADALALAGELPAADQICDLGSGAGFPGIPLAILRPDVAIDLVESRERRHHFQRAAIRELGLRNVRAVLGRAEHLEPQPRPLALAQALAEPSDALRLLVRWVPIGGLLCLPIGSAEDPRAWRLPSGVVGLEHRHYEVRPQRRARALWIGRRVE